MDKPGIKLGTLSCWAGSSPDLSVGCSANTRNWHLHLVMIDSFLPLIPHPLHQISNLGTWVLYPIVLKAPLNVGSGRSTQPPLQLSCTQNFLPLTPAAPVWVVLTRPSNCLRVCFVVAGHWTLDMVELYVAFPLRCLVPDYLHSCLGQGQSGMHHPTPCPPSCPSFAILYPMRNSNLMVCWTVLKCLFSLGRTENLGSSIASHCGITHLISMIHQCSKRLPVAYLHLDIQVQDKMVAQEIRCLVKISG